MHETEGKGIFLLQEDFEHAVQAWSTIDEQEGHALPTSSSINPRLVVLRAFQQALQREMHVLTAYPDLLWQQLYNRLQWEKEPVSQILEDEKKRRSPKPWLRLRTPTRETPALIRTFASNTGRMTSFTSPGISAFTLSPDGKLLLSADTSMAVRLWDVRTGQEQRAFQFKDNVTACAFRSDSGAYLLFHHYSFGSDQSTLLAIRDALTGQVLQTIHPSNIERVAACAFSLDGKTIFSACPGGTLTAWDTVTGQKKASFEGIPFTSSISCSDGLNPHCAFSSDGSLFVTSSEDRSIQVWGTQKGKIRTLLVGHSSKADALAISSDASVIGSVGGYHAFAGQSEDYTLKIWDVATGKEKLTIKGLENTDVRALAFSPDNRSIVAACWGEKLRIWDTQTGREHNTIVTGHTGRIIDHTVRLWDVATGQEKAKLVGHPGTVQTCAFSPDGRLIASAGGARRLLANVGDYTIKLWNAQNYEQIKTLIGHNEQVTSCAFSPDGTMIASASFDRTLKLWNVQAGQAFATLTDTYGPNGAFTSCAFSPDGTLITASSDDRSLRIWNVQTGKRLYLMLIDNTGNSCAFSPDGMIVFCVGEDRLLKLWDVHTFEELAFLPLPGALYCLAIHPSLPYVVCGGAGGDLHFIELENITYGLLLVTAREHQKRIVSYCPKCRSILNIKRADAGKEVTCPRLGCAIRLRINPTILRKRP